jgi:hypothetical protein
VDFDPTVGRLTLGRPIPGASGFGRLLVLPTPDIRRTRFMIEPPAPCICCILRGDGKPSTPAYHMDIVAGWTPHEIARTAASLAQPATRGPPIGASLKWPGRSPAASSSRQAASALRSPLAVPRQSCSACLRSDCNDPDHEAPGTRPSETRIINPERVYSFSNLINPRGRARRGGNLASYRQMSQSAMPAE